MTLCGWRGSGNGLAESTLRTTSCDWHGSGNGLAETHSANNMRLTWIGQWFGWDALCEWHYAADVDRTTVWLRRTLRMTLCGWRRSDNSLTETHSANNIMRLTWIGQRFGWDALWATSCGWHRSGNGLAETHSERHHAADIDRATVWLRLTLPATSCGWHRSDNSTNDTMRLT